MKITIEFDQKESAAPSDTEQLIDSKITDAKKDIVDEITNAILKATSFQFTPLYKPTADKRLQPQSERTISVGIKSSAILTACDDTSSNLLSVEFVFLGKIMQPEDYQPFIDKLQLLCENFNRAS